MGNSYVDEPILEAFVYEMSQIVEMLEQVMITSEKSKTFSDESINEIFRFMHTIKGSSAMMMFNSMSMLAHRLEDIFYVIREDSSIEYDFTILVDIILESVDYFKIELMKIENGESPDDSNLVLIQKVSDYLEKIKNPQNILTPKNIINNLENPNNRSNSKEKDIKYYSSRLWFKKDCEMENIRCYTVVHNIVKLVDEIVYKPRDIIDNDNCLDEIRSNGFLLMVKTREEEYTIKEHLEGTIFLQKLEFYEINSEEYRNFSKKCNEKVYIESEEIKEIDMKKSSPKSAKKDEKQETGSSGKQSIISVNVEKLDKLMDMVGELVISEAMVTQNPEIMELQIESFEKASRQLHKITGELQDLVMAIRMVPLSNTFMKMHRVVRDMTRKLGKNVFLDVYGEETEVDKNIIEKIADPLMHIIRNSMDHGIEDEKARVEKGKDPQGLIVLEAKNSGSDVLITIKDDGKGLNKKNLYDKALLCGLISKSYEEMTDRELYNLILQPGFSTKEEVTEFSGRGVGMDVVAKNIQSVGGTVLVESIQDKGTTIILKIPLTLAIIEGMNIKVGESRFTIPMISVKESFRPKNSEIITDIEGNEMIMVRGICYPILRLHEFYGISKDADSFEQGILIMIEDDDKSCCIFADELLGQQQVVVKSLPEYIKKYKKVKGLGGCTLLGDGNISLILNVSEFNLSSVNEKYNFKEVRT